jgi:hypothetical protein
VLRLPGFAGFRIVAYSRVDGLALAWGPELAHPGSGITLRPTATWRTQRRLVDPSFTLRMPFTRRAWISVEGGRMTATNDGWTTSDLEAAAIGLVSGVDLRNWYRADRADAALHLMNDGGALTAEVWGGGRAERAWESAPSGALVSYPWTISHPGDASSFRRSNPVVATNRLTTALAGAQLRGTEGMLRRTSLTVSAEQLIAPWDTLPAFTQVTIEARLFVPTWGGQGFAAFGHGVSTRGTPPPQRLAWLGGPGTLLTVPLLSLGGDHLAFGDVRYIVPFGAPRAVRPTLALRWARGAAAGGTFGSSVTNVGAQLDVGPARLEYAYDPAARRGITVLTTSFAP